MDFQKFLYKIKLLLDEKKYAVFFAVIVGAIVYYQFYSNALTHPDGILSWGEFKPGAWELSLGRWSWTYLMRIRGYLVSPSLSTFFMLLFLAIAGVMLCELLSLSNNYLCTLVCIIIICSPVTESTLLSYFCSDIYGFAFLLAVLAVVFVVKVPSKILGAILGAISLALALSVYQSNIGVTAGVSLLYIVFLCLHNKTTIKNILKETLNIAVMGLLGTGLYYVLLQYFLKLNGVVLSAYRGADNFGLYNIISNLGSSIKNAYYDFWGFFFGSNIVINSYGLKIGYCCFFLFIIIGLIILLKGLDYRKKICCLLCIILIPAAVNLIDIIIPGNNINSLMAGGACIIIPCLLCGFISFNAECKLLRYIKGFMVVISILVCWSSILIYTADAVVFQVSMNKNISLANRIFYSLEEKGYTQADSVLVLGMPGDANYPASNLLANTTSYFSRNVGLVWSGRENGGNANSWGAVFNQYLGINLQFNGDYMGIIESEEFANMPIYPEEGSVRVIDGTYVVKISNTF